MESILSFAGVSRFTKSFKNWKKKKRRVVQEIERENQIEDKRSDDHDHGDDIKDSNILSHGACADDVTLWTR